MAPLLNIFLLLSSNVTENFVPLKTYISENAKIYCKVYFIDENISNFARPNIIEKNIDDFLKYLDSVNVEHSVVGSYYFFKKKEKR